MAQPPVAILAAILTSLFLPGPPLANSCAAAALESINVHAIALDAQCRPVSLGDKRPLTPDTYAHQLHVIADSLRASPVKHICLFVHGGMNSLSSARSRTQWMTDSIARGGYYPLCVNWESGLGRSYWHHLRHPSVPFGLRDGLYGMTLPPFRFAEDVIEGLARWPSLALLQFDHNQDVTVPWYEGYYYPEVMGMGAIGFGNSDSLDCYVGVAYNPGTGHFITNLAAELGGLVMTALRVIPLPILGSFPRTAWENMLRRTRLMLRPEADMLADDSSPRYRPPDGALAQFVDTLQAVTLSDTLNTLTLIGHSMGTIVLSEILREYPELPADTIVFMGSAAPIRDYETAILPFLARHGNAQFFNLTLHPLAELKEGFAPLYRGSLLVWLDDFVAPPLTLHDSVLGRYANLGMASRMTPPHLRTRVHFRVFDDLTQDRRGYGITRAMPMKHSDFTSPQVRFWRSEFWIPGPVDSIARERVRLRPTEPHFPAPNAAI